MCCSRRSLGVTTYALLTGFSPFGGDTDQETFCNISNADIDFPDELFEDVSAEAVDFIRKLLVKDPRERLTAKECLKHPWLANLRKSSATGSGAGMMQHHQQHQQPQHLHHSSNQLQPPPATKRSGCNTCAAGTVGGGVGPSATKRGGLQQSYLSKSREALFERIVSKHMRQKNDSKRSSLLLDSQYASSRMCESHTSLVSRSRCGARTFSKSKEKLYGLKSLSRSQDVLNMCKSIKDLNEVDKIATVGSLLMSLTGVSTLPNSLCSSTANISVSQSHISDGSAFEDDKENVARNGDRDATNAVATVTAGTDADTDDNSTEINVITANSDADTASTATAVTPTDASRAQSPAGSSASSVEHFYHSDEEPR